MATPFVRLPIKLWGKNGERALRTSLGDGEHRGNCDRRARLQDARHRLCRTLGIDWKVSDESVFKKKNSKCILLGAQKAAPRILGG